MSILFLTTLNQSQQKPNTLNPQVCQLNPNFTSSRRRVAAVYSIGRSLGEYITILKQADISQ
jgi:hypothetical protein